MTVERLNFKYQETDRAMITFHRPGVIQLDLALGRDGNVHIWEDLAFYAWKANGERPEFLDIVPRPEEKAIYISAGEIEVEFTDSGAVKYIKSLNYQGPIGRLGYWLSMSENSRQDILNLLYDEKGELNPEILKFAEFLDSEDLEALVYIIEHGVEDMEAYAKISFLDEENARIVLSKGYYTGKFLSEFGNNKEALDAKKEDSIRHELLHAYGIAPYLNEWLTRAGSERKVGEYLAQFYEERAEALKGTKQGKIYEWLAERARAYAERYIWYNRLGREILSDPGIKINSELEEKIQELIAEYTREAIEKGYDTEEGISDYVANKLKELTKEDNAEEESEATEDKEESNYEAKEQADDGENPDDQEGEPSDEAPVEAEASDSE